MLRRTVLSHPVKLRRSFEGWFREDRTPTWWFWDRRLFAAAAASSSSCLVTSTQRTKKYKRKPCYEEEMGDKLMAEMRDILSMPTSPMYDSFFQSVTEQMPSFPMEVANERWKDDFDDLRTKEYRYADPFVAPEDEAPPSALSVGAVVLTRSIFQSVFPLKGRPRRKWPLEFATLTMQLHQRVLTELYLQMALSNQSKRTSDTWDIHQEETELVTIAFFEYFFDIRLVLRVFWVWNYAAPRRWKLRQLLKKTSNTEDPLPPPPKVEEVLFYLLYVSHLSPSPAVFSMKTVAVLVPRVLRQRAPFVSKSDAPILAQDFFCFMRNVLESPWVQKDALNVYSSGSATSQPLDLSSGCFLNPKMAPPSIDVFVCLIPLWIDSKRPETKERLAILLQEMERDGLRPNAVLLAKLLPYYIRPRGGKQDTESFLAALEHKPHWQPDRKTFSDAIVLMTAAQEFRSAHRLLDLMLRIQVTNERRHAPAVSQRRGLVSVAGTLLAAHRVAMKQMVHHKFRGAARMAKQLAQSLEELGFMDYVHNTWLRRSFLRTMMHIKDLEKRPIAKRPQKNRRKKKRTSD
jgi:hypothetical protein